MANHQPYSAAWQQFLLARRAILAQYDRARSHALSQPVATHHGNVAEAAVRDWLGAFLPKRFGVTSGYIRSQAMPEPYQSAHFDVIVYDQLKAPTLWIGEAKRSDEPPPNVKAVFEKVRRLLEDEAAQNELYMPEMSRLIAAGPDVDRVADGVGDFGRDLKNPIPVNGALGELIYISQLMTATGSRFLGHRLGSISNIDVYEIVSLDRAQWDVLYFDLYHPRKSRVAPRGLRLNPNVWILATNYRLDEFPRGLRSAVSRCTREFIGLPFVCPTLFDEAAVGAFQRPVEHLGNVRRLEAMCRE